MAQNDEIYIGDSSKVLCLRNSGQIKLQYGNRYINLFDSEGNLNARIKDLIHIGTPSNSSEDGFYFTPSSNNKPSVFYVKQGNQILNISGESSGETNLPEGSIIMYKGSQAPDGWQKFDAPTDISGTIYIINSTEQGAGTPDLYDIWLDWLDSNNNRVITATAKIGESFNQPQLRNLVNNQVQLQCEYSSSDIGVATIDSNGTVRLVSPGWTIIKAETQANGIHKYDYASYTLNVTSAEKAIVIISVSNQSVANTNTTYTPVMGVTGASLSEIEIQKTSDPNNIISSISGQIMSLTGNVGTASLHASISETSSHKSANSGFILTVTAAQSSFEPYTVGLISDVHYHVMGNPNIIVDGNDDSNDPISSTYKKSHSLFREDLEKIISEFEKYDVDFVASTGDISSSDINDFIEFTNNYKTKWSSNKFITSSTKTYTNLTNTTESTKSVNQNMRDFYCVLGNHDCQITYKNTEYCNYYRYGYPKGGAATSGIVTTDHNGERWTGIKVSNNIGKKSWNGTSWNSAGFLSNSDAGTILNGGTNINFDCPGSLAGNDKIMFDTPGSQSYYITRNNGNDMFIFLSTHFGKGRYETFVDTASSTERDAVYSQRVNGGDMSQIHGYNRLSSYDINRLKAKMSQDYSFPGNEEHFNFQYFLTDDLLKLEELLRTNAQKRCFVFEHFFLPHKAGGGNQYEPGTSAILSGITFHFLNYLNNTYKRSIWFSGHSHISWQESNMLKGLHWTNQNYPYVAPTPSDNTSISADGADSTNDYFGDYGKLSITGGGHYDSTNNMWKVTSGGTPYLRASGQPTGTSAWNVHLPSMSRPIFNSDHDINECEAAIMKVYEDHVEIKKIEYSTNDNGSTYNEVSVNDPILTIDTTTGNGTCNDTAPELTENEFSDEQIVTYVKINSDDNDTQKRYVNSKLKFYFTDGSYITCYNANSSNYDRDNLQYCLQYNKRDISDLMDNFFLFPGDIPTNNDYFWWKGNAMEATDLDCGNVSDIWGQVARPTKLTNPTDITNNKYKLTFQCINVNDYQHRLYEIHKDYIGKTLSGRVDVFYYVNNNGTIEERYCESTIIKIEGVCKYASSLQTNKTTYYDKENQIGDLKYRKGENTSDTSNSNNQYGIKYTIKLGSSYTNVPNNKTDITYDYYGIP